MTLLINILAATLLIGLLTYFLIHFLIRKNFLNFFEETFTKLYQKTLDDTIDKVIKLSEERLKAEKQAIKTDLENKQKLLENLIDKALKELREAERDRISKFHALAQSVKEHQELVEKLRSTTESLRRVLSNNQLRGQFGEQVAEDLLKMSGFVKGVDYEVNTKQSTKTTRPDFAIFLPDGTKINIDVKFPYENLRKAAESEDAEEKKKHIQLFKRDVKEKINQVSTRDYINPEEKTVDFVILFVPNETIFSFIYDKMNDVWQEALRKKVILTGPFSFTAILRMIRQAYENFRFQQNIKEIIGYIKAFQKEFEKYSQEFEKIGTIIQRLEAQYNKVQTTRTRQLLRVVEKISYSDQKQLPMPEKIEIIQEE